MSMTLKSVTISTFAIGIAAVSYLSLSPSSPVTSVSNTTQQCEQLLTHTESTAATTQCLAPSASVTWSNWVKGESRSAQFHFIDLFELLFSSNAQQRSKQQFNQQSSL